MYRRVKARKQHRSDLLGCAIEPGQYYILYQTYGLGGGFQRMKLCEACAESWYYYSASGHGETAQRIKEEVMEKGVCYLKRI